MAQDQRNILFQAKILLNYPVHNIGTHSKICYRTQKKMSKTIGVRLLPTLYLCLHLRYVFRYHTILCTCTCVNTSVWKTRHSWNSVQYLKFTNRKMNKKKKNVKSLCIMYSILLWSFIFTFNDVFWVQIFLVHYKHRKEV